MGLVVQLLDITTMHALMTTSSLTDARDVSATAEVGTARMIVVMKRVTMVNGELGSAISVFVKMVNGIVPVNIVVYILKKGYKEFS